MGQGHPNGRDDPRVEAGPEAVGRPLEADRPHEDAALHSRLETQRIVTQALYESTVRNLDTAKSTALKRTTFISIFSDAQIPEESRYPQRFSQWLIIFGGLLTLWMTATLIWMSVEDHRV